MRVFLLIILFYLCFWKEKSFSRFWECCGNECFCHGGHLLTPCLHLGFLDTEDVKRRGMSWCSLSGTRWGIGRRTSEAGGGRRCGGGVELDEQKWQKGRAYRNVWNSHKVRGRTDDRTAGKMLCHLKNKHSIGCWYSEISQGSKNSSFTSLVNGLRVI